MLRPAVSRRELMESSNAAWISVPIGRVRCSRSRLELVDAATGAGFGAATGALSDTSAVSVDVESLRALATLSVAEVVSDRATVSLAVVSRDVVSLAIVSPRAAAIVSDLGREVVVSGVEGLTAFDG